jgi:hypothetical protein
MGDSALHQLSDPTGGRVYRVGRDQPLDAVFKELSDEMRSQYAIGYTPLNPAKDGAFRKLDVRMANKDLKAQARKGYYAIKPEVAPKPCAGNAVPLLALLAFREIAFQHLPQRRHGVQAEALHAGI